MVEIKRWSPNTFSTLKTEKKDSPNKLPPYKDHGGGQNPWSLNKLKSLFQDSKKEVLKGLRNYKST